MRKLLISSIMAFALIALMAGPTFACGGEKATTAKADKSEAKMVSSKSSCSASKTAKAEMVSADKKACSASKTAKAEMVSADKKACSASKTASAKMAGACDMTLEECLAKCGMTPDECREYSNSTKYEMVNMNISGMTCGGCESQVKATLASVKGVEKVAKVDHKSGTALVIVKKDAHCNDMLTTAVTNKGYDASVIPAVATSETASKDKSCSASAAAKKACAATCAGKAKATNVSKKVEGTN
ncbi:hypothetical protein GF377_07645 [candidate division GN15 bacterium]|nr:hypothetical protein [candidate division GN15 bacterium]